MMEKIYPELQEGVLVVRPQGKAELPSPGCLQLAVA